MECEEGVSSKPVEVDWRQVKQLVINQGGAKEDSSETQEKSNNYAEAHRDVFQVQEQRNSGAPEIEDTGFLAPPTEYRNEMEKSLWKLGSKDATIKGSSKNVEMGLDVVKKIWIWDPGGLNVKETDNTGKENDIPCVGVYRRH